MSKTISMAAATAKTQTSKDDEPLIRKKATNIDGDENDKITDSDGSDSSGVGGGGGGGSGGVGMSFFDVAAIASRWRQLAEPNDQGWWSKSCFLLIFVYFVLFCFVRVFVAAIAIRVYVRVDFVDTASR
jgi:hypothetical protein